MYIVILVLNIYSFILLLRVLSTWVPNLEHDQPALAPVIRFLHQVTEPILQPIRRVLPAQQGFDFSPLVVFILISVLTRILVRL